MSASTRSATHVAERVEKSSMRVQIPSESMSNPSRSESMPDDVQARTEGLPRLCCKRFFER